MGANDAAAAVLRDQVLGICVGTAFVVIEAAAWLVAAVRRRAAARLPASAPRQDDVTLVIADAV